MTIQFTCQCGKSLKASDTYAGKRVRCPCCDKMLQIPVLEAGGVPNQRLNRTAKLYRCVECENEFSAGEVFNDQGEIICKHCFYESPSPTVSVKKAMLILTIVGILLTGICYGLITFLLEDTDDSVSEVMAGADNLPEQPQVETEQIVSDQNKPEQNVTFKPLGFLIVDKAQSTNQTNQKSKAEGEVQTSDKRMLFVVVSMKTSLLLPSDEEYQQMKKEGVDKGESIAARDRIVIYDPLDLKLILSDGRLYSGEKISGWESDANKPSSIPSGFSITTARITISSPNKALDLDKMETIAIGWTLDSKDCEPPFKIAFGNDEPVPIPNKQFPAPPIQEPFKMPKFDIPTIPPIDMRQFEIPPTIPPIDMRHFKPQTIPELNLTYRCPNCGVRLRSGQSFCRRCRRRVTPELGETRKRPINRRRTRRR